MNAQFADSLYRIFSFRYVIHGMWWLLVLVALLMLGEHSGGFWFNLTSELINLFFYGIIVYFNLLYLIPNYLAQKKFLSYGLLLILTALILTPIKVILLYFKSGNYPLLQEQLIDNQNAYFFATLFMGLASTIIQITSDWLKHLREKQELQTQTMQSELRFLKSQINPHFLFNTLNNLYALTLKKSDQAPEIVIKLSEMMRYMLYECNEKRVLLSKEINYIQNYLDLERIRQGKNVKIDFHVDGSVSDQKIAPLMFIPFLENSFKHGLNNHINSQGFVDIKLLIADHDVHFYIENSKADMLSPPTNSKKKSGGIGLVNVKRRLNLLYPEKYHLAIDNKPKSYAVRLDIELED